MSRSDRLERRLRATVASPIIGTDSANGRTEFIQHPLLRRDYWGADTSGTINLDDYGLTAGEDYGFKLNVELRIHVEAIA